MTRCLGFLVLVACGSASPPPKPPPPPPAAPVAHVAAPTQTDEAAHKQELADAHHKLEVEQQDALAATCEAKLDDKAEKHERCLPSCYPTEAPDPRAGKKVIGTVEIVHLVCEPTADGAAYVIADELEGGKLGLRPVRGHVPKPHKKGSWQEPIETALVQPKRRDVFVVAGGWRDVAHPLTGERLRCVQVSRFAHLAHPIDGCGGDGSVACEATGNPAARGLNVVHYRLAEAKRLQRDHKLTECQQAALEAVAVARGLPRWRQYVKLNINKWVEHAGYRTRFDGTLDEDTLFATAARLGSEAEALYAACGGAAGAPTTPAQEQSFHTCW